MYPTHVIYQPGQTNLQSVCSATPDGVLRCHYQDGKPAADHLADLNAARDPGTPEFQLLKWDEVDAPLAEAQEKAYVTPWEEITKERHSYYLECLPPCRWKTVDGVNLFYISEAMTSDIHQHCAKFADRYFARHCRTSTPYSTLTAEVRDFAAAHQPATV